jgi:hypothetical protein
MKIFKFALAGILFNFAISAQSFGQLRTTIDNGFVRIVDNNLFFIPLQYRHCADSLDKLIKARQADTLILFERALIYNLSNNQLSKPAPGDKDAFVNLLKAENLVNQANDLKMQNIKLKVLRAQIYRDLTYRFAGDEAWKFSREEIQRRKSQFNNYKMLANKYYKELAEIDEANATDYSKLCVTTSYPIRN